VTHRDDPAERLRQEFDGAFARAAADPTQAAGALLAITAAGTPYVVSLAEVSGARRCGPVTLLPDPAPGVVGLATVQAALVVVYDLAWIVDPQVAPRERPWLLVTREDPEVGLAVDAVQGLLRARDEQWLALQHPCARVERAMQSKDIRYALVGLAGLASELRAQLGAGPATTVER
jgi:chemotaxis signal transduction protein